MPKMKRTGINVLLASEDSDPRSRNEFSRQLRTSVVLSPRRKEYAVSIAANEEELGALAKRFSLSRIDKLEANLVLARGRSSQSSSDGDCITVEGDVVSTVSQTCVRTNEDFNVDLEFELMSIVRATAAKAGDQMDDLGGLSAAEVDALINATKQKKKGKKRGGRKKAASGFGSKQNLNEVKIRELEDMLQDFNFEDDVVEDESVFASDGILDIGELVAQMFRLKLDPYPKKPGSEPVRYSITG